MTTASTAVSAPPAYYSVSNPEDPTVVRARELVRREYELRRALSADLNPEHDVDVLAASIARSTGFGRRAIQNNLMAMLTLHELPPPQNPPGTALAPGLPTAPCHRHRSMRR